MKALICKGILCLVVAFYSSNTLLAQSSSVTIGPGAVKSNAVLWLVPTGGQGLLLPSVATGTRTGMSLNSTDDKGMIVYDNQLNKVFYWNGTGWLEAGGGTSTNPTLTLAGNTFTLSGSPSSNVNLASNTPSAGQALVWNGTAWTAASLSGDVTGTSSTTQVAGLKGKLLPNLPGTTQALVYDGTSWIFQAIGTGSGEANTASNVGTAGVGVFKQKNLLNLEFQKINAGSNLISVTQDVPNSEVDINVNQANLSIASTQVTGLGTLATLSAVGTAQVTDLSITNADIASSAAIDVSKLNSGGVSNNGLVLKVVAGALTFASDDVGSGSTPTLAAGQILAGNGTTNSAVAVSGDLTMNNGNFQIAPATVAAADLAAGSVSGGAAGTITDASITSADLAAGSVSGGAAGTITDASITSADLAAGSVSGGAAGTIADASIINADISAAAAIAVTKLAAGTNTQVLTTVSGVPTWAAPTGTDSQDLTLLGTTLDLTNDGTPVILGDLSILDQVTLSGGQVTGILSVANGGTGRATWDGLLLGAGAAINDISNGTNGQILKIGGTTPGWADFAVKSEDITDETITSTDIANGTITASDLATNISISTTGNLTTTGTGNLTIAGASTLTGTATLSALSGTGTRMVVANATGVLSTQALPTAGWGLTGNAGTTAATNFIGTTDAQDLSFRTNNALVFRLATTGGIGLGATPSYGTAGQVLTSGGVGAAATWTTISGTALSTNNVIPKGNGITQVASSLTDNGTTVSTTLDFNIATGKSYMINNVDVLRVGGGTTGHLFVGDNAGAATSTSNPPNHDTFIGVNSGVTNTTGTENTFVGRASGFSNTTGSYNVFLGKNAGYFNTVAGLNTFVGYHAGYNATGIQGGSTHVGAQSGENSSGDYNTYVGEKSAQNTTSGEMNTFVGRRTGFDNVTGSRITLLGHDADVVGTGLSNAAAIGYNATVAANNSMVLGATGANAVNVGIGITAPETALHVVDEETVFAYAVTVSKAGNGSQGMIAFEDGDGTFQGGITLAVGSVSYNAFTGSHYGILRDNVIPDMGKLVSLTGVIKRAGQSSSEPKYEVIESTTPNDPKVMGAYLGYEPTSEGHHLIMAVGNGEMWVVDNGTNLSQGDYLISSAVSGHAMKDNGEFEISYIVARVAEPVEWAGVTDVVDGKKHKRISVFFESFTRNHKAEMLEKNLEKLQADVKASNESVDMKIKKLEEQIELLKKIVGVTAKSN